MAHGLLALCKKDLYKFTESSECKYFTFLQLELIMRLLKFYAYFVVQIHISNHTELQASEHPWMHFSTSIWHQNQKYI